jgi:hypothetical protein
MEIFPLLLCRQTIDVLSVCSVKDEVPIERSGARVCSTLECCVTYTGYEALVRTGLATGGLLRRGFE